MSWSPRKKEEDVFCIVYFVRRKYMHIFTYQKSLLHKLFSLFIKSLKPFSFQCILNVLELDVLRKYFCPCKNWYLRFYKAYDYQIWQAGTPAGFDSNATNHAGAGEVITSRSRHRLKSLYLY